MTPLRQRMIEALQLRGMSERTQEMSVRAVRQRAEHSHPSPEPLTDEALRQSVLSRTHVKHASRSASTMALCGITFVSAQTLHKAWPPLTVVRPPQERTLPALLSMEAGHPIRQCGRFPRYRVCLRTLSAWGLRLQEGTHVQVPARESARLVVHVRGGTGAPDRSGPRPPQILAWLRQDWTTHRNPGWLLPAPGRSGLGMSTASTPLPRPSVQDALRAALQARGIHTRASGHT